MTSTTSTHSSCPMRILFMLCPLLFASILSGVPQSSAELPAEPCDTPAATRAAVMLTITGAQGEEFQVKARDGQTITYRDFATGRALAIRPRVIDTIGGDLDLDVHTLVKDPRHPGAWLVGDRRESLRAKAGYPSYVPGEEFFRVDITAIIPESSAAGRSSVEGSFELGGPGERLLPAPGGGPCCLTCGNVTVCGCSVRGSCGSCTGDC